MNLKKLLPELVEQMVKMGFDKEPRNIQSVSIPKIKSGSDAVILSSANSGKSVGAAIALVQLLKKPVEKAPRAIIMVQTKQKAFEMEELFDTLSKYTGLRSFVVFDEGKIQFQKDMIYEGLDLVIGTPKRLNELISTTGIPLTKVKHFFVDDMDAMPLSQYPQIYRIADSVERAQYVLYAKVWRENFDRIEDRILRNPLIIKEEIKEEVAEEIKEEIAE